MASWEPLKTVVAYALDQYDKSMGEFDKAWLLGFRAINDIERNFAAEPKSVRLPVGGNKTVTLPNDYVSYSKIGIVNDKGEVVCLKTNNALSIFRDNNPDRITDLYADINDLNVTLANTPFFLNYYYNGLYQNLFGVGGGLITYGSCRVDERNNVIILNEDFQYDSIILEYISSPQKDEDYMIDTGLREAVIAFIGWRMKMDTEQNYYARCTEARRRLPNKRVNLTNINEVLRQATGQYLKA